MPTLTLPIRIHPGDELPIYRQIVRQVLDALAAARLAPGDRLESHRQLAARLVIAPLTVKKAYDELERAGYVETRRGQGTFVCAVPDRKARAVRAESLRTGLRRLLSEAAAAGMGVDDFLDLVRVEAGRILREEEKQR